MSLVLCRRCRLHLFIDSPPSPSSLPPFRLACRGLKLARPPQPPPHGSQSQPGGLKWFIHRLHRLPDAPLRPPHPLPPGARGGPALQLAVRAAAAAAAGGLLCLVAAERRRRWPGGVDDLQPFDFGYVARPGEAGFLDDLRRVTPFLGFCLATLVIGNLLRSRRLSPASLSAACRHLLDRPGYSSLVTSPWLSSLCVFHASEVMFSCVAIAVLSQIEFGFSPEEMILIFITGALSGSAVRCAYQWAACGARFGHWQGPHAGLAALVCLLLLAYRRDAIRIQSGCSHGNRDDGAGGNADDNDASMPRSARRFLLELRPGLYAALLAGWAAVELAFLLLARRPHRPGVPPPLLPGRTEPGLQQVSSLAGIAAGWCLHVYLERQLASLRSAAAGSAAAAPATAAAVAAAPSAQASRA